MDNHTAEQRRKNMRAIKNKDTRIEVLLRKELWRRGLRYRKNPKSVFGKPDIVFLSLKIAVFCDSEFWHGYAWSATQDDIKTRRDFWIPKIEKNISRDIQVTAKLRSEGWTVLRFWGREILQDTSGCADLIEQLITEKKSKRTLK